MNRRKALREGCRGCSVPTRRLSMVNLRSKTSNLIQRHQRTENSRLKSIRAGFGQNDRSTDQNGSTPKDLSTVNAGIPKVRFNADNKLNENRSNSSPRLKNFPAETIKKYDNAPMFPPKSMMDSDTLEYSQKPISLLASEQRQNQGHGDTSQTVTINPQDLPNTQEIGNDNQSKVATLSQNTSLSPGRQAHRPFVPNVPHEMGVRDRSPLIATIASYQSPKEAVGKDSELQKSQQTATILQQVQLTGASAATANITSQQQQQQQQQQSVSGSGSHQVPLKTIQSTSPWKSDDATETPDYQKQPVGGRNALAHRRVFTQQKNPIPQTEQIQQRSDQSTYWPTMQRNTNISQNNSTMLPVQQAPQQNFQQLQHNVSQQQQHKAAMQQQAIEQSWAQQPKAPTQQMQMNQRSYGNVYTVHPEIRGREFPLEYQQQLLQQQRNSSSNNSAQNNRTIGSYPSAKAQLNPFVVNLVNSDGREASKEVPQYRQFKQSELQPTVVQQQAAKQPQLQDQRHHPYQCSQQHQQYSDPPCQGAARTSNSNSHQQQEIHARGQSQVKQQQPQEKKKGLEFTPEMIRDQEQLISNMRQQRVSEDVMRRQFNILLNEQKRQLAYLEQLRQEPTVLKRKERTVRRITKIQNEQKPEWMIHITPPRVTYCDIERIKNVPGSPADRLISQEQQQQRKEQIQQHDKTRQTIMQSRANNVCIQQGQPTQQQLHDLAQKNTNQSYQHQPINWQQRFNHSPSPYFYVPPQSYMQTGSNSVPNQHQANSTSQSSYNSEVYQHSQQPKYLQYPQHFEGQQQQEMQDCWLQSQKQEKTMDTSNNIVSSEKHISQPYQEDTKNAEFSSLLKLKKYKEVIRPQKQNNGLQDPETVQEALEALKKLENKKGLEYLTNLNGKEVPVRLNGAQDPDKMSQLPAMLPLENRQEQQREISANGLENSRNPNNPTPRSITHSKNLNDTSVFEYPRQKQTNLQFNCRGMTTDPKNENLVCSSLQSESQQQQPIHKLVYQIPYSDQAQPAIQTGNRHEISSSNERSPTTVSNLVTTPYKSDQRMQPQYYQQIQQCPLDRQNLKNNGQSYMPFPQYSIIQNVANANQAGGDAVYQPVPVYNTQGLSQIERNKLALERYLEIRQGRNGCRNYGQSDICQPITVGGLTYLARASSSIPKSSPLLPETIIPSKSLQPLMKSN